ncbi:SDR family oxidoreductase [Acinetobacter sp.]|uniref:SDR family oxidoreductase n=1 Tax=Acinetobacter sp. TaxID=472 RepID=UPI0035AFBEBE
MKKQVNVVIGAGAIGIAIARRMSAGKTILIADLNLENAERAAKTLREAGFQVETTTVDISSKGAIQSLVKRACELGEVHGLIHAAGVSPSQATPEVILKVDLYGTAVILEEFGQVIAEGGSGVVISSQSGHRLPALSAEKNKILATTPSDELLAQDFLSTNVVTDTLNAYQISKRGNALRVMAEAVKWKDRGGRINTISPGIVITPLALDELNGPRGESYRNMLDRSPAGRAGTADEIANVAELLMTDAGAFITGSDFLIDGGVTASYWFGELDYLQPTSNT